MLLFPLLPKILFLLPISLKLDVSAVLPVLPSTTESSIDTHSRWTLDYLEPGKRAELGILLQGIQSVGSGKIVYNEYDWTLNSSMVQ